MGNATTCFAIHFMRQKTTKNLSPLVKFFDKIYIINLATRIDRLLEVNEELEKIGVDISHPKIQVFKATKPIDGEGWPTIGTKGCFQSHLAVLTDALKNQYERILILEDDVNFIDDFNNKLDGALTQLKNTSWDIFYGGYRVPDESNLLPLLQSANDAHFEKLMSPSPDTQIICCHFVAFNKATVAALVPYLEQLSSRPMGHPEGGKMHLDGAYSWFRKNNPAVKTYLSALELCYQRSSATDIHELKWFDVLPFFKTATSTVRKIKNQLVSSS